MNHRALNDTAAQLGAILPFLAAAVAIVALSSCTPSPVPPSPDAGDAGAFDASTPAAVAACANLASLGCAEGRADDCVRVLTAVQEEQLTPIDLACMSNAKDQPGARKCPGIRCAP